VVLNVRMSPLRITYRVVFSRTERTIFGSVNLQLRTPFQPLDTSWNVFFIDYIISSQHRNSQVQKKEMCRVACIFSLFREKLLLKDKWFAGLIL